MSVQIIPEFVAERFEHACRQKRIFRNGCRNFSAGEAFKGKLFKFPADVFRQKRSGSRLLKREFFFPFDSAALNAELPAADGNMQIDMRFSCRQRCDSFGKVVDPFADFVDDSAARNLFIGMNESGFSSGDGTDGLAVHAHFCDAERRSFVTALRLDADRVSERDSA